MSDETESAGLDLKSMAEDIAGDGAFSSFDLTPIEVFRALHEYTKIAMEGLMAISQNNSPYVATSITQMPEYIGKTSAKIASIALMMNIMDAETLSVLFEKEEQDDENGTRTEDELLSGGSEKEVGRESQEP